MSFKLYVSFWNSKFQAHLREKNRGVKNFKYLSENLLTKMNENSAIFKLFGNIIRL